ncbi:Uncharacterised protein [Vibrio cholerae]|nr:Uncharacterised protein [Vibrio cholerae]
MPIISVSVYTLLFQRLLTKHLFSLVTTYSCLFWTIPDAFLHCK